MGRKRGDDENDDDDYDEKENYIVTKNAKPDNGVANLFEEVRIMTGSYVSSFIMHAVAKKKFSH
jgi:hypothetical protein